MRKYAGLMVVAMLLAACGSSLALDRQRGTAWGPGAFGSNGERIYFTSTNEHNERIRYTGAPSTRGMMMGGILTCASCHGPNGTGGQHVMHMEVMDSPDVRWSALESETDQEHVGGEDGHEDEHAGYDLKAFELAVVQGRHPDGEPLKDGMPRWKISDEDLRDLADYLKSLP